MAYITDWLGRPYEVEIAFVRFLGGYVVWIDDEPFDADEVYPSRRAAWRAVKEHFK